MQIVRLQCPACGAAFTVPAGNATVVCAYCGSRFAVGSEQVAPQKTARPAPVVQATVPPAVAMPTHSALEPIASFGRGCVAAVIAMFVLAPLLTTLLMLPVLPFLPEDAAGQVQTPEVLALCYGIVMFVLPPALAIYAFLYFRRPQHSIGGFFIAPFRGLVRRLRGY